MRKAIFLGAFLLAVGALTSCSKDEPKGPEANLTSVDGTEWVNAKATLKFRNGKYTINCAVPGSGTYTQSGSHITFDGNLIVISGGGVRPTEGEISKYGTGMTVKFVNSSGVTSETLNFVYVVD